MAEAQTLWVRLNGEDLQRAEEMRDTLRRSYSNLLKHALDHYYKTHYLQIPEELRQP